MRYAIKVGLAGGTSCHLLFREGDARRELMNSNASCSGVHGSRPTYFLGIQG